MDTALETLANWTNVSNLDEALDDAFDALPPFLTLDRDANPLLVFLEYSAINVIVTSVIPLPLAGTMVAVGALIYGIPLGMLINTVSSTVGAWLGLVFARHACRPCLMRMLGRYRRKWEALDYAIVQEGWQIALLIRLAPVAPLVLSNVLLAMTSISHWTYIWTSAVGFAPSNLPFAYAAQLGKSMAQEFPPKDPVLLTMSILGLVASVAIAWKIGRIATRVLRKHGLGGDGEAGSAAVGGRCGGTSSTAQLELRSVASGHPPTLQMAAAEDGGGGGGGGGSGGAQHGARIARRGSGSGDGSVAGDGYHGESLDSPLDVAAEHESPRKGLLGGRLDRSDLRGGGGHCGPHPQRQGSRSASPKLSRLAHTIGIKGDRHRVGDTGRGCAADEPETP